MHILLETKKKLSYLLLGYVIMPNHVHLLIVPDKRGGIQEIIKQIQGDFSQKFKKMPKEVQLITKSKKKSINQKLENSLEPNSKIWEKIFHEHIITNKENLLTNLEYIHQNPVRAGLTRKAEEYKYSSIRGDCEGDLMLYLNKPESAE